MTWLEFKEFVESSGITDDFTILYIDASGFVKATKLNISVDFATRNFYIEN